MSCELVRYKLGTCRSMCHRGYPNVMCYCTMQEAIIMFDNNDNINYGLTTASTIHATVPINLNSTT